MRKDKLLGQVHQYLEGYKPIYYMTLNSHTFLSRIGSIEDRSIDFNRKKSIMISWIGEYLMGSGRTHLIRSVSFNELGTASGMLHCHVVVGLAGASRIPLSSIQTFVNRKWPRLVDPKKNGERPYWTTTERLPKMFKIRDAIHKADCDVKFEHELDDIAKVQLIDDTEKALGYQCGAIFSRQR
jgi:hypothetical protein